MTLKTLLCGLFCDDAVPKPFMTLRHRSGQHLQFVLQKQFPNAQIRIPDTDLSAPSLKDVEVWLHNDLTSEKKYHAEWYDCEDFAREIRCKIFKIGQAYKTTITIAYCEGHAPDGYHGYNLLIDEGDKIYIIEPQNDHCVPVAESDYRTTFIQL
jgi:hypothetical protein